MKFKTNDILIGFQGKPNRTIYYSFIAYVVLVISAAAIMAFRQERVTNLRPYFYIDFCTAIMLAWFLAKSFRTQPLEKYVSFFRIGLFILFNCLIIVLSAGLDLVAIDTATLVVSVLFVPAMILVILSFNDFISFINYNYKSAIDLSMTDELTGLPNRRSLNFTFRDLEKKAGTVCVIDIDYFKRINDTFGHETGDKVLISLGLVLNGFIDKDVFISRSGGEEFCVILTENADAAAIIDRIKQALTLDYNKDISITISMGVAAKRRSDNFTLAMISADEALYRAKREGRNCIVFADTGVIKK